MVTSNGAEACSSVGSKRGGGTVIWKLSSSTEMTMTSFSNGIGLEEREDGTREEGMNDVRLIGRESVTEKDKSALEGERECTEDTA